MVIRRVGPLSCAKIGGVVNASMGLLIGALFTLFAFIGGFGAGPAMAGGFPGDPTMPGIFGLMMGVGAIIFAPLFYGVIGFVGTLIVAVLYNLLAAVVGGIEIQVE